jgi:hypothetical protein
VIASTAAACSRSCGIVAARAFDHDVVVRTAIVVALITAAGGAAAAPAPTVAVYIASSEPSVAKLVVALAAGLRDAAGKPGPYRAKGTAKAVAEAIDQAKCTPIEPACAAAIGEHLAVDYMIVGKVEPRGARAVLAVSVVKVEARQRVRSLRAIAAAGADGRQWARAVYAQLVDDATGELAIVANAQAGEIFIDGVRAAELFKGRATVVGLAIGNHELSIRAPGYRAFDEELIVDGHTRELVLLVPR